MQKKIATIAPAEIPEVVEFIDANDAIQAFKESHPDVFREYSELVDRYNTALENADKVVRARQVSSGPFDLYSVATKYDAEALYNAVGRDKFLEVGGKLETKTEYTLDKGRLEAAAAQRKIGPDVIEQVRKETPNYHKPPKLVVP